MAGGHTALPLLQRLPPAAAHAHCSGSMRLAPTWPPPQQGLQPPPHQWGALPSKLPHAHTAPHTAAQQHTCGCAAGQAKDAASGPHHHQHIGALHGSTGGRGRQGDVKSVGETIKRRSVRRPCNRWQACAGLHDNRCAGSEAQTETHSGPARCSECQLAPTCAPVSGSASCWSRQAAMAAASELGISPADGDGKESRGCISGLMQLLTVGGSPLLVVRQVARRLVLPAGQLKEPRSTWTRTTLPPEFPRAPVRFPRAAHLRRSAPPQCWTQPLGPTPA